VIGNGSAAGGPSVNFAYLSVLPDGTLTILNNQYFSLAGLTLPINPKIIENPLSSGFGQTAFPVQNANGSGIILADKGSLDLYLAPGLKTANGLAGADFDFNGAWDVLMSGTTPDGAPASYVWFGSPSGEPTGAYFNPGPYAGKSTPALQAVITTALSTTAVYSDSAVPAVIGSETTAGFGTVTNAGNNDLGMTARFLPWIASKAYGIDFRYPPLQFISGPFCACPSGLQVTSLPGNTGVRLFSSAPYSALNSSPDWSWRIGNFADVSGDVVGTVTDQNDKIIARMRMNFLP
jgi:hypothetical protein